MAVTAYRPVSFTDGLLKLDKLQQTSNNIQWLYENSPRIRVDDRIITKDSSLRILAGKTAYLWTNTDYIDVNVQFKNFFTPGCRPIVTATVETLGWKLRKLVTVRGFGGEIDHRGFWAHVTDHETVAPRIEAWGIVSWIAVGY